MILNGNLKNSLFVRYGVNDFGLIKAIRLTVALIWEVQSYVDANDCFHIISFEFEFV